MIAGKRAFSFKMLHILTIAIFVATKFAIKVKECKVLKKVKITNDDNKNKL